MSGAFLGEIRFPLLLGLPAFFFVLRRLVPSRAIAVCLVALQLPSLLLIGTPIALASLFLGLGVMVGGGLAVARRWPERAGLVKGALVGVLLGTLALVKYPLAARLLGLEDQLLNVTSPEYWGLWGGVGTSYLVFRLIAVVIDHRQGAPHGLDWLGLAAFSVFAPCSVAGPLLDSQAFHRDLRQPEPASVSSIVGALTRIVVGLVKVVVLGGTVSFLALGQVPLSGSLVRLLLAAACYSVYIYCDFSGYTDMSVGWARLWGFKVPENFDRPYLSEDLQEFWSRWHISLSLWLKRYLFYPLNLALTRHNPRGARRFNPAVALLMTFTLAGAWHGEGLGFIVFGLLHGLGVALGGPRGFRPGQALGLRGAAARLANRAATFAYVSVCWIPFVYSPSELRRQFPAGTSDLVIAAHSSQRGNGQGVPSEDRQSRRHTRSAKGVSTASPIPQPAGFE